MSARIYVVYHVVVISLLETEKLGKKIGLSFEGIVFVNTV